MKRPSYDKRMNPIDNWRYKVWRPFRCWVGGHNITCYRVIGTWPDPSWYSYICHCCFQMTDHIDPCGTCNNGCRDREEGDYV